MKFFATFVLTALLGYVGGLFFDWWIIAVAAFIVAAVIPQKPYLSFLSALLGMFVLWFGLASYIDMSNEQLLSGKIAALLFKQSSPWLIKIATGLVGGITAGFSGLTGCYFRRLFS